MHIINTLLGFDFGIKRIGVAVGQQVTKTANPLSVIKIKKGKSHWNQIEKLMKNWQPNYLVVGLPLNMDGSEQPITTLTYEFVDNLYKKFGICIKMQDERLSTVEARATLFERGGYKALQKGKIDSYSAVIILEDWFANYLSKS